MAAGAWYQTIAMATDALREATDDMFGYTKPTALNETFAHDLEQAIQRTHDSTSPSSGGTSGKSAESSLVCKVFKSASTATGNCSLGQAITGYLVNFSSTSGGGWGQGSVATINPILSMKTMGDYLMEVGGTIQRMGIVTKIASWLAKIVGMLGKVLGTITGQPELVAGGQAADMVGDLIEALQPLAIPLILLGLLMAVYIPLIPFISWFGALVSYATVFVEAIVAAPLWAMAHLDANGEGMGSRTQHGYLFVINMLLRPILMLIGFIAASALMIILGSILYALYMPAIANVQGDSITGVNTILALLAIFWLLNFTLIQGAMNLIFLVPDQVLNWIGHAGQSQLGKEMEQKVYGALFSVAASARGMITGAAGAKQAGQAAKAEQRKHNELLDAIKGVRAR